MRPRGERRGRTPPDARLLALEVLTAVESGGAYSDPKLEQMLAQNALDRRDRDLATLLVQETLRRRGTIDWVISLHLHVGLDSLSPRMRNILRLGACQLFFMDRIPAHAAVHEAVRLARRFGHPGTAGLVNAVLRRLADLQGRLPEPAGLSPEEALAVRTSHPAWLLRRWTARLGVEGAASLAEANNRPARITLRANSLRTDAAGLAARLRAEGHDAERCSWHTGSVRVGAGYSPRSSDLFRAGFATVQDEGESLVTCLVDPKQGEWIADPCAAPGTKATHLVERARGAARVAASDVVPARVAKIPQAIARLGLSSVYVFAADLVRYSSRAVFDAVLLDAPCSGLGVLSRRADARWRKSEESIARAVSIQRSLLLAAADLVRPGGRLVYSVCSIEPEEGWGVVTEFLDQQGAFGVEPAGDLLPKGIVDERGALMALPHVHGTDGVFAVRLRRRR